MTAESGVPVPVHRQAPHLFTHIDYTLNPEGLLEEEYTSEVLTHTKVLPYEDVWDGHFDRDIPLRAWIPAGVLGLAAALALLAGYPLWAAACAAAGVGAAASALALGWRCIYTAHDFEGHWVVTFEGRAGEPFQKFLGAYRDHVQARRFPLQKHLEGLPLGDMEVAGPTARWACRFRYDRIVVESSGPWRRRRDRYYSLSLLRAPVRLVWKPSWGSVAAIALAAGGWGLLAWKGPATLAAPWVMAGAGLLAGLGLSLALGRMAVSAPAGDGAVESPALAFFRRDELRRLLLWFSRLANLSDRIEELRSEDYWEYHREKVNILREQGFLEEWPYRSALGKINSQERENFAPES